MEPSGPNEPEFFETQDTFKEFQPAARPKFCLERGYRYEKELTYYKVPVPSWSWVAWVPLSVDYPSPWYGSEDPLVQTQDHRVIEFYAVSLDGR